MSRQHKFTLILLFVAGLLFQGRLPAQDQARLTIRSTPKGAKVMVDSAVVGTTPVEHISLSPGKHIVQVFPPDNGVWNITAQTFTVTLSAGQDTTLKVTFQRPLFITSIPPQATIWLDSLNLGTTPEYLPFEMVHGKTLTLTKNGYMPYTVTIRSPQSLTLHLQRKQGFTEKRRPPLLNIVPHNHQTAKFTLMATTVISHWAAFLLKRRADYYYDRYQHTAQPNEIEYYWNQTRKFDRMSDIALGLSYASLSAFLYLVIFK